MSYERNKYYIRFFVSRIRGAHIRTLKTTNGEKDYILIPTENGMLKQVGDDWAVDAYMNKTKDTDHGVAGMRKIAYYCQAKLQKFLVKSLTEKERYDIPPIAYIINAEVEHNQLIQFKNNKREPL